MKTLRGVLVGAGYFSRFHLDAWSRLPGIELAAVCDRDLPKAERAAAEFKIPRALGDVDAALDLPGLDFVDLATPPDSHVDLVGRACRRKLAVLCQKPLAPDGPSARALADAVAGAGIPFMVHDNFRFQPWYLEIRRLLADGSRVLSLAFRTRTGDGWRPDAYLERQPYFREMPRLLVFETGVHFIDVFRSLAGEIDEVYAILRRLNPAIRGEDAGLVTFRFANGAVGSWDASRYHETTATDPRYTFGELLLETDRGSLRLDGEGRLFVKPLGRPEREHAYPRERRGFAGDCVHAALSHFAANLREGRPFETGLDGYLRTFEAQEAVYRSAAENRPVRLGGKEPA
jgi:predicted dehydrogenase